MNKNILVILFCIVLVVSIYYCYNNNKIFEGFKRTRLSAIYGVHSSRNINELDRDEKETIEKQSREKETKERKEKNKKKTKRTYGKEDVIEIGHDELENKIFKYKNKMYLMNEENALIATEPKKITYKSIPTKLPVTITADTIKSKIPLKFMEHKFKGLINNYWYRQYYILYEKEYDNQNLKDKYYTYLLVKNIDNELTVIHKIPPRNKLSPGDTIYFSYGNFQLGPLNFV
jgi:hypothetical protein